MNMTDLFAKVTCTYCQEEIKGVRIQCCVCSEFDICLQCFLCGAEIGPHRNDHAYKFVDHCAVAMGGRGNWTGTEELQLLEAAERYGYGNWDLISQCVETRTPEEVKEEFVSRYLDGNIGKMTWGTDLERRRPNLPDHVPDDNGPLAPSVTSRLPPLDATPEEAALLGYRTHRDDYEREYNMAAEQLVSGLQLDMTQDSKVEIALKLARIDMYTRKLRERARRKRLIKDYQLVAKFFAGHRKDQKRNLSKEQRELRENMKVFSQFLTSGEHERLINSIERERELRFRLSELIRYRGLGLTTKDEIFHYEQHAAFQNQQKQNKSSGSSGSAMLIQEDQSKNGRSEGDQSFTERKSMLLWEGEPEHNGSNNCSNNWSHSNFDKYSESYIRVLPLGSLLSQYEVALCSALCLHPVQYLTLKTLIIQDNLLTPHKYKNFQLDQKNATVKDVVTQYLLLSGWLP